MKDKDKLILILTVGVKTLDAEDRVDYMYEVFNWFKDQFDDSVKIIPIPDINDRGGISVSELNTKSLLKEEVNQLLRKTESLIEEYKSVH